MKQQIRTEINNEIEMVYSNATIREHFEKINKNPEYIKKRIEFHIMSKFAQENKLENGDFYRFLKTYKTDMKKYKK